MPKPTVTSVEWNEHMWDGLDELMRLIHDVSALNSSNQIIENLRSVIDRAEAQLRRGSMGTKGGFVHTLSCMRTTDWHRNPDKGND